MSRRIIISGSERRLKPIIPFIMSIFITGMGEIYSGSPQRGVILALIRTASALAIPFYSITNIKCSHITEIFFSILIFSLVTIFSPLNALILSYKKKTVVVTKFISARFITLFILCNFILTLLSAAVFFSFFSVIHIKTGYPPFIEEGDIAVVKKINNRFYNRGEMTVVKNSDYSFVRIIGQPGETVTYNKSRFSVNDSELFQSIFTENEMKKFYLTDYDVISETSGMFKYPVIQNKDKHLIKVILKNDEYFAAPDDRNEVSGFVTLKTRNIYGRMEGILFSVKRIKFLIKPFQIAE